MEAISQGYCPTRQLSPMQKNKNQGLNASDHPVIQKRHLTRSHMTIGRDHTQWWKLMSNNNATTDQFYVVFKISHHFKVYNSYSHFIVGIRTNYIIKKRFKSQLCPQFGRQISIQSLFKKCLKLVLTCEFLSQNSSFL